MVMKFLKPKESQGQLIKRFLLAVKQEGIIEEAKRDYWFESNHDRKLRKQKERQREKKKLHF